MAEQDRAHRRILVRIPVKLFISGKPSPYQAELLNLSEGGGFLACESELEPGQELNIQIRFHENELLAMGRVVRDRTILSEFPKETPELSVVRWSQELPPRGFGIEFQSLSEEKRIYIRKLMEYYDLLQKAGVNFGL